MPNPTIKEALARFRKWKYDNYFYEGGLRGVEIFIDLFVLADAFEEQTADTFWEERREKNKEKREEQEKREKQTTPRTLEEALEECKKWRMSDEELKQLME